MADGVHRYSEFEKDALGRGFRTFAAMAMIYFGTKQQAEKTGNGLNRGHGFMKGVYQNHLGEMVNYTANEPELLAWVLATLTDTTFYIAERGLWRLPEGWKAQFFEESKQTARLFGISEGHYPSDMLEFERYFEKMTSDGSLHLNDAGQRLCSAILKHPVAKFSLGKWMAAASLPHAVSASYGLKPTHGKTARFEALMKLLRLVNFLTLHALRYAPAWHQAQERVAREKGHSFSLLGRFYFKLGKKKQVPLGILTE